MTPAEAPSMAVDPRRLARMVLRRFHLFLVMLVVAPTVAVTVSRVTPRTWKAQARVLVQDSSQVNPLLEDLIVPWKVNNRVPIMTSVLKSDRTTRAVLDRLGKLQGLTLEQRDERVRAFKARVDAFAVGGGLVAISLTASSATDAKEGLQALVDEFVEEMLRPQKQSVSGSATFLSGQIARLRTELQTLEDQLTIYKTDNANELPEVYKLNLDTWLSLRKQMTDVEVRLQGATRRRALLEERLQLYNPVAREIEARLISLQAHLREQRATWRDDAPEVLESRRLIAALEAQLAEARAAHQTRVDPSTLEGRARSTLEVDADGEQRLVSADPITGELFAWKQARDDEEGARGERELLQARVDDAERAVRSFARNEASLNRLNRDFETKSVVYRSLLEKYEDALITRELSTFNESAQVWIVDPPVLPTIPQNPPLIVVLLGALIGGQLLAFLLALLLDFIAGACVDSGEAARRLGVTVVCPWSFQGSPVTTTEAAPDPGAGPPT